MGIIAWHDGFLLGVPEIDAHHRHLVELLNQTHDAVITDAPAEDLNKVVDQLIGYATYHFIGEERLMEKILFPRLAEHKEEHGRFTRRVEEIQTEYYQGNKHLSVEILLFLMSWLTNHILESDAAYGKFMADNNIVPD